jgi:uncharacterized RDD family membrane protein YckC
MMPQGAFVSRTKATLVERFVGAFIDGILLFPIYFVLAFIPFLGWAVAALIGAAWWLLRDAKGLSVGKKVMSLEVISKDGGAASEDQLMKRNYTLAGGAACGIIPVAGPMVGGAVNLIECILLIAKGERYGDEMAGTMVVKKIG